MLKKKQKSQEDIDISGFPYQYVNGSVALMKRVFSKSKSNNRFDGSSEKVVIAGGAANFQWDSFVLSDGHNSSISTIPDFTVDSDDGNEQSQSVGFVFPSQAYHIFWDPQAGVNDGVLRVANTSSAEQVGKGFLPYLVAGFMAIFIYQLWWLFSWKSLFEIKNAGSVSSCVFTPYDVILPGHPNILTRLNTCRLYLNVFHPRMYGVCNIHTIYILGWISVERDQMQIFLKFSFGQVLRQVARYSWIK